MHSLNFNIMLKLTCIYFKKLIPVKHQYQFTFFKSEEYFKSLFFQSLNDYYLNIFQVYADSIYPTSILNQLLLTIQTKCFFHKSKDLFLKINSMQSRDQNF